MNEDTPGDDPREIAAARHEGLVDDVAWQALLARHGLDLERAAAEHAAIAEALSALPRTAARPGAAAAIIEALPRATSVHARRRSLWWAPLLAAAACLLAAWFLFTIDGPPERASASGTLAAAPMAPAHAAVRAHAPGQPGKSGMPAANAPGEPLVAQNDQWRVKPHGALPAERLRFERHQRAGGQEQEARMAAEERSRELEPDAQDVRALQMRGIDGSFGDAPGHNVPESAATQAMRPGAEFVGDASGGRPAAEGGTVVAIMKDATVVEAPAGGGSASGGPSIGGSPALGAPFEHGDQESTATGPAPGAVLAIAPPASDQAAPANQVRRSHLGAPGAPGAPGAAASGARTEAPVANAEVPWQPPLQQDAQLQDAAASSHRLAPFADTAGGPEGTDAQGRVLRAVLSQQGVSAAMAADGGAGSASPAPLSLFCVSKDTQAIVLELEWRAPPAMSLHRGALLLQGLDREGHGVWTMATHLPPADIPAVAGQNGRPSLYAWRDTLGPAQQPPPAVIALRLLAPGYRSDPVSVVRPPPEQSAALPTTPGAPEPALPASASPASPRPAAAPPPSR